MKKILAIGASNSQTSINKQLAVFIANQITDVEVIVADLNDFEMPLYGPDRESKTGIPKEAQDFNALIESVDGIVLSIAEYNGLPTPAFKNVWDWSSRIEMKLWRDKPIFLASTSPGKRGGASALASVKSIMPYCGGQIILDFSLPSFQDNFSSAGLTDPHLAEILQKKIKEFESAVV